MNKKKFFKCLYYCIEHSYGANFHRLGMKQNFPKDLELCVKLITIIKRNDFLKFMIEVIIYRRFIKT